LQPSPDRPLVTPLKAWSSRLKPERSIHEFSPVATGQDQQPEAQAWHRDGQGRVVLGAAGARSVDSRCLAKAVGR
jgi:hypothetical protein